MTLLETLLNNHKENLSETEISVMENIIRRNKAIKKADWPTDSSKDHIAFAKLERVFTQTPTPLFGQDAPALAYSRLSVWRGVEENGTYVPGDLIFSTKMSEQAVTRMILSSNRGSQNIPTTMESFGDLTLPPFTPGDNMDDSAYDDARTGLRNKVLGDLEAISENASAGGAAKARAKAKESISSMMSRVAMGYEAPFYVEQRMGTYNRRRVDVVSEMAHAALHADKITNATALLEAPDRHFDLDVERQTNPMLDAFAGRFTVEDEQVLRKVMLLEIEKTCQDLDIPRSAFGTEESPNWPQSHKMPGHYHFKDGVKKELDARQSLFNSVWNTGVCQNRRQVTPHAMGVGVSQIHGWTGYLHSSLPATDDTYFTVRFSAIWEEKRFGHRDIYDMHSPVIEFGITSDDLMMMLRGHPMGKATPITLKTVYGVWRRNLEEHISEFSGVRHDVQNAMKSDPKTKELVAALEDLADHMDISGGGKAWKEATAEKVATIDRLARAYLGVIDTGFEDGDHLLRQKVGQMVRESLDDMRAALPADLAQKLLPEV
jgi:hypothetical protein